MELFELYGRGEIDWKELNSLRQGIQIKRNVLPNERVNEIFKIYRAYCHEYARAGKVDYNLRQLKDPNFVPVGERIRRFNLKPEFIKKLRKHNISLDARLNASSDARSQLPYLVALFDSMLKYDVYLSQNLERYPARVAFTVESQEDEDLAHMLACQHARALEDFSDKKFNDFLKRRGRKPLPPRSKVPKASPVKPAPKPAPAPVKPSPAPAPAPAPAPKRAKGNPQQLRLF